MDNIPHKITGDSLTADEFNNIPEEEENVITSSGQALSAGDLYQIAKAVAIYTAVGDFYIDSGSGNAYVLTAISPLQAPVQYLDGMRIRFRISHTNTGAATVNVNGLGIKDIKLQDGVSILQAGDLPVGEHGELVFHADLDCFELYSHKYESISFKTGDWKFTENPNAEAGWIIYYQDGTVGSAISGATIRANLDCEDLFKLLWDYHADTECPVDGGRGISSTADWLADKKIHPPAHYNRVLAAKGTTQALGSVVGEEKHTMTVDELVAHKHNYTYWTNAVEKPAASGTTVPISRYDNTPTSSTGGGQPFNVMQPTIYVIIKMKL